jgi:hypothetical protein
MTTFAPQPVPTIPAEGSAATARATAHRSRTPRITLPLHLSPNIPAGGSAPSTRATAPLTPERRPKRLPSPSVGRGRGRGATGSQR